MIKKLHIKAGRRLTVILLLSTLPFLLTGCGATDFFDTFLDPMSSWLAKVTNPVGSAVDEVFISDTSIMMSIINASGLLTIRNIIKRTAIGVASLLFLLGIIDEVSASWDIKGLIKPATKAALALYVIEHANTLRTAINGSGRTLISKAMGIVTIQSSPLEVSAIKQALIKALGLEWVYDSSSTATKLVEMFKMWSSASNVQFLSVIGGILLILILSLWLWVIKLQCLMQCYSAIIEIAMLESMFPLGCAWLANDGFRGQGGRFLKRLCACYIKIALFAVICMIYQSVAVHQLDDGLMPFIFSAVALGLSCVELMKGCAQVADTIMGI